LTVVSAIAITIGAACAAIDTVYVSNGTCNVSGPGTSLSNAYCSIGAALANRGGGPDTVFAVVGTGTPYRDGGNIIIAASDAGTAGHPFVLMARGSVNRAGFSGELFT
jgi:hypothetical protein